MNYEEYEINTIFSFGKYKGKKLSEVVLIDPSYINWCIVNKLFYLNTIPKRELSEKAQLQYDQMISNILSNQPEKNNKIHIDYSDAKYYNTIDKIKKINPSFELSQKALDILKETNEYFDAISDSDPDDPDYWFLK